MARPFDENDPAMKRLLQEYISEYIAEALHMGDLQDYLDMGEDGAWEDFQLYLGTGAGISVPHELEDDFLREWREKFVPQAQEYLREAEG